MADHDIKIYKGKTYSLFGNHETTDEYYRVISDLTDLFLKRCPDEKSLLMQIRKAGGSRVSLGRDHDKSLISYIKKTLNESLALYTEGVREHLRTLPLSQRLDSILRTKEAQYHLYMIEIELVNRIYKEAFKKSKYKFALIAHCLRDFRPDCRSAEGDIESVCKGCTKECFVHLASLLLNKYDIHPYISLSIDLDKLFKKIRSEHQSVGALGIACVPELTDGMRSCIKLDIAPVGIPLDANCCARWMGQAQENSFSLEELESIIR